MALVDWELAAATAARLGPTGPSVTRDQADAVVAELRTLADEAAVHVAAYTGLTPQLADAPTRVVDRRTWAAINIDGLRTVAAPVVDKPGNIVTAKVGGVQAGTLLAYLSGKVLGQYEVFAADPGRLLLVAPNIVAVERKLDAVPRDFRLWVCLHEQTHRLQFTAVPWLREHFLGLVRAYVTAAKPGIRLDKVFDAARGHGDTTLLDAVQSPEQRQLLDRLTEVLTLLEGHAEVVMDGVGPDVIPSVVQIRRRFDKRRTAGSPVERYLRRMLGIDIKLKQYAEGKRFVHGVLDRVGMAGLNRIWESPQTLPQLPELAAPQAWVARVHG